MRGGVLGVPAAFSPATKRHAHIITHTITRYTHIGGAGDAVVTLSAGGLAGQGRQRGLSIPDCQNKYAKAMPGPRHRSLPFPPPARESREPESDDRLFWSIISVMETVSSHNHLALGRGAHGRARRPRMPSSPSRYRQSARTGGNGRERAPVKLLSGRRDEQQHDPAQQKQESPEEKPPRLTAPSIRALNPRPATYWRLINRQQNK